MISERDNLLRKAKSTKQMQEKIGILIEHLETGLPVN